MNMTITKKIDDEKAISTISRKPLTDQLLFPNGLESPPNWRTLKDHLNNEGRISKDHCLFLISKAEQIFSEEPNLVKVRDPVTVVGDIHGQYYDMLKLLEVGGEPGETQYLFLGDYVDRGCFSVAVVLLLLALKINYPTRIWMLRGNHECRQMTGFFNFKEECLHRYDNTIYLRFMELFDCLPLGATINNKFVAVHGGLSPDLRALQSFSSVDRFSEPPKYGLFCDLIWADPIDEEKNPQQSYRAELFSHNDVRGCSYFFSHEAAATFLDRNKLLSVVRAHEAQIEGYKMHKQNARTGFPSVITIFSAPNYCDFYNNKGAILLFENNTLNIQQFNYFQHPYCLPNFMDIFSWSIPFVADKVVDMLGSVINDLPPVDPNLKLPDAVLEMLHSPPNKALTRTKATQADSDRIRLKILAMGRLVRAVNALREEADLILEIKKLSPKNKLPAGTLLRGSTSIHQEMKRLANSIPKHRRRSIPKVMT